MAWAAAVRPLYLIVEAAAANIITFTVSCARFWNRDSTTFKRDPENTNGAAFHACLPNYLHAVCALNSIDVKPKPVEEIYRTVEQESIE